MEFRNLTPTELAVCTEAARPGGVKLRDTDPVLVEPLHKRGLLYLEVPIRPDDHVSIPPLEVFIPSILNLCASFPQTGSCAIRATFVIELCFL